MVSGKKMSINQEVIEISVKDLNLWYDENHALIDIEIEIPKNRITALIGPSGCGKTTFIRCLDRMNDLIPGTVTKGEILVNGGDITRRDVDVVSLRKKIGMVFQKPNPFPSSIFENIAYGPRIHGENNKERLTEIVEESLKRAALWDEVKDRLNLSALSLSGGQQQRLCIARTLAVEPDIILFDEPCSALDP